MEIMSSAQKPIVMKTINQAFGLLVIFVETMLLLSPATTVASSIFKPLSSSSSTVVKSLPGFQGPLPFHLETGYIGVDEANDVQLFYYFIKSERNPKEDPLLLWITGGPGCSAFSGLVYEIGPLRFNLVEYNGSLPTFSLNAYSWTKASSIIFLDTPVGTGFSYSKSTQGWSSSDTLSAKHMYTFLQKWLSSHPEFNMNPVYIAGDSYSGIVVPILVQEISNGIESQQTPFINLKGYILGNPVTAVNIDFNSRISFAHRMGFISDEIYKSAKRSCKGEYVNVDPSNAQCALSLQVFSQCTARVNLAHVLEPSCLDITKESNSMEDNRRSLGESLMNFIPQPLAPEPYPGCRNYDYLSSVYWANDDSVRDALHIKMGTTGRWKRCNANLSYIKNVQNSVVYHLNLSTKGYRALIYSGDHDMDIPYLGTLAWIKSLNFSITNKWRPWFVDDQIAGYTRSYSNKMTFATVKGGGHTAPQYKPEECLEMLKRWTSHKPL